MAEAAFHRVISGQAGPYSSTGITTFRQKQSNAVTSDIREGCYLLRCDKYKHVYFSDCDMP
jgi:hypothetical protein